MAVFAKRSKTIKLSKFGFVVLFLNDGMFWRICR